MKKTKNNNLMTTKSVENDDDDVFLCSFFNREFPFSNDEYRRFAHIDQQQYETANEENVAPVVNNKGRWFETIPTTGEDRLSIDPRRKKGTNRFVLGAFALSTDHSTHQG